MATDKFGHCVNCSKELLKTTVVDGDKGKEVTTLFAHEYDQTSYLLTDGSAMRVTICKTCKVSEPDVRAIMESVRNGWEAEMQGNEWTTEKRQNYRKVHYIKEIISNVEGKDNTQVQNEYNRYLKLQLTIKEPKEI